MLDASGPGIPELVVMVLEMRPADVVATSEVKKLVEEDPPLLEPVGAVELAELVELDNPPDVLEPANWVEEVVPAVPGEVDDGLMTSEVRVLLAVPIVAVLLVFL